MTWGKMVDLRRAYTVTTLIFFVVLAVALACASLFAEPFTEQNTALPEPTPTPVIYILLNS